MGRGLILCVLPSRHAIYAPFVMNLLLTLFFSRPISAAGEITINAGGRLVGEGIGAGEEEDFVVVHGPDLRLLGDGVEAGAEFAQVIEEICEILCGGFAADDGHAMYGGEEAAGEEFVFVGAAGMGEDEVQRHEVHKAGPRLRRPA